MSKQIFVNLPIKDLGRSMEFFKALGFSFNPQFTDEKAACLIISDDIFFMLLTEEFFKSFIKKDICDSTKYAESIMAISVDSREEVDVMVKKALASGGKPSNDPSDYGFMYSWSFQDPDDHLWEVFHMDPSQLGQT